MTTIILVILTISSILLIAGFILIYVNPMESRKKPSKQNSTFKIKPHHYGRFLEHTAEDTEKVYEEAEKEYKAESAKNIQEDSDGSLDVSILEKQILIAKDKNAEHSMRLRAGEYLLSYNSMPFLEELISKLAPEDQDAVYETIQIAKEPIISENGGEKPWESSLKKL